MPNFHFSCIFFSFGSRRKKKQQFLNCAWLQLDIIEAVYKTVYAPSNYYCIHLRAHCARILLCVSTCWCATVCLTLCFNAFAKRWSRNTETELLHKCLCLFVVFARSAILFFTFILFFSFCLCALLFFSLHIPHVLLLLAVLLGICRIDANE